MTDTCEHPEDTARRFAQEAEQLRAEVVDLQDRLALARQGREECRNRLEVAERMHPADYYEQLEQIRGNIADERLAHAEREHKLAAVETELRDLRGQNAMTEQHFRDYAADMAVRERDLLQLAERVEAKNTQLREALASRDYDLAELASRAESAVAANIVLHRERDEARQGHGQAVIDLQAAQAVLDQVRQLVAGVHTYPSSTHGPDCHRYHVGCLAVLVRRALDGEEVS